MRCGSLLEEVVRAVAMTEIEVLPGRAARRGAILDALPIDQHLDGPDVAAEVARVGVGLCQAGRHDLRVVLGRLRRAMAEPRLQLRLGESYQRSQDRRLPLPRPAPHLSPRGPSSAAPPSRRSRTFSGTAPWRW